MPERINPSDYIQTTFSLEPEPAIAETEETQKLIRLHESLAPYIDTEKLRQFVAEHQDLKGALRSDRPPADVIALLDTLAALLRPSPAEQIRSPADVAGILMVQMGHLDQEELRTVLLDTKNRVQDIVTIYRGSVNTAMIRAGEVYKPAVKRNSTALIIAHNHPSNDPTPSPEDVLVTKQIVEAGTILDIECLDHLVICQSRWVSMRERGLGFTKL